MVTVTNQNEEIVLSWTDTSEIEHGDFPFEGYTVLQGKRVGSTIEYTEIPQQTYDLVNGYKIILDSIPDTDAQQPLLKVQKKGNDRGVKRYFSTRTDYNTGEPLSNLSEYFYRIEAYSYNPSAPAGDRIQPSKGKNVTAVPQGPPANYDPSYVGTDVFPVTHVGNSDGTIVPTVMDPTLLTGHDYQIRIDTIPEFDTAIVDVEDSVITIADSTVRGDTVLYFNRDSSVTHPETTITTTTVWELRDMTLDSALFDTMLNQSGDDEYPIVDGFLMKVLGPPPGLKGGEPGDANEGWAVSSGARRFTQIGGDGLAMEGFRATVGWANEPSSFFGSRGLSSVGADRLRNIELRLAVTDSTGVFDPGDPNVSYAYRWGRNFQAAAAKPEFAPFIINTGASYDYQDYVQSMPLAVYDIEADPPRRLAVGFLENNVADGEVNGRYWPPYNAAANGDNVDAGGPREWLFIFDADYTGATPDAGLQVNVLGAVTPIMYHATWTRRDDVGWSPGGVVDGFELFANHVLLPADTFSFTAAPWTKTNAGGSVRLDDVRAVPNPYYLYSSYDNSTNSRQIRFSNLPERCTISIYTITGDLVSKVEKNSTDSWAYWDVQTDNGIPVASGIYIWVVDAPGIGQKIGKMAVFTEVEQLPQY